jgi:hypothetical protein
MDKHQETRKESAQTKRLFVSERVTIYSNFSATFVSLSTDVTCLVLIKVVPLLLIGSVLSGDRLHEANVIRADTVDRFNQMKFYNLSP